VKLKAKAYQQGLLIIALLTGGFLLNSCAPNQPATNGINEIADLTDGLAPTPIVSEDDPAPTFRPENQPVGGLHSTSKKILRGWVYNPDDIQRAPKVHLYADGKHVESLDTAKYHVSEDTLGTSGQHVVTKDAKLYEFSFDLGPHMPKYYAASLLPIDFAVHATDPETFRQNVLFSTRYVRVPKGKFHFVLTKKVLIEAGNLLEDDFYRRFSVDASVKTVLQVEFSFTPDQEDAEVPDDIEFLLKTSSGDVRGGFAHRQGLTNRFQGIVPCNDEEFKGCEILLLGVNSGPEPLSIEEPDYVSTSDEGQFNWGSAFSEPDTQKTADSSQTQTYVGTKPSDWHFFDQKKLRSNACGPTSLAMIMANEGMIEKDIAAAEAVDQGIRRHTGGTSTKDIIKYANEKGLHTSAVNKASIDDLENSLRAGNQVMIMVSSTEAAHWMVVIGVDTDPQTGEKTVLIADPAGGRSYRLTTEQLYARWSQPLKNAAGSFLDDVVGYERYMINFNKDASALPPSSGTSDLAWVDNAADGITDVTNGWNDLTNGHENDGLVQLHEGTAKVANSVPAATAALTETAADNANDFFKKKWESKNLVDKFQAGHGIAATEPVRVLSKVGKKVGNIHSEQSTKVIEHAKKVHEKHVSVAKKVHEKHVSVAKKVHNKVKKIFGF